MKTWTVLALRVLLIGLFVGSLVVQVLMLPVFADDLNQARPDVAAIRIPVVAIIGLGIVAAQVVLVCVWQLLTMVNRDTVFSAGAFKYVDVVSGAAAGAALLAGLLAVVLAPGEPVPPGVVLLVCGGGAASAGVALVVLVLRMLLAQAVAREQEARQLRSELDEVI